MAGVQDLLRDLTGESWERLFPFMEHVPHDPPPYAGPPVKRLPCDVKRLPASDMNLFGHRPETDPLVLISCVICDKLLLPFALRHHIASRHGDEEIADSTRLTPSKVKSSLSDSLPKDDPSEDVVCSLCSITVPSTAFRRHTLKVHGEDISAKPLLPSVALKLKTVKKSSPSKKSTSKSASASPPELNDEVCKDLKKSKSKKCKSPVPPELEPILPEAGKRTVLLGGPPELQPADVPKKSSKKKAEKKVDKVFDPNKNCGVINEAGKPCLRSIFCKAHLVAHKRAVLNRSMPYDMIAKMMKNQNESDRRPKLEVQAVAIAPVDVSPPMAVLQPNGVWPDPPEIVKEVVESNVKRTKTDDFEELPSHIEALIEATLNEDESLVMMPVPVIPRPLARWSLEEPLSPPTPPPPPFVLADLPGQPTHPRPLATNTFGCRLVGGLLTKNKKLDEFRKHVHSVWGSSALHDPKTSTLGVKAGGVSPTKKSAAAATKRKRKSSGSSAGGATPDMFQGFLQRAAAANAVAPPPNGVNGVPLRLYNNTLTNSQPTFIQLCPSK